MEKSNLEHNIIILLKSYTDDFCSKLGVLHYLRHFFQCFQEACPIIFQFHLSYPSSSFCPSSRSFKAFRGTQRFPHLLHPYPWSSPSRHVMNLSLSLTLTLTLASLASVDQHQHQLIEGPERILSS